MRTLHMTLASATLAALIEEAPKEEPAQTFTEFAESRQVRRARLRQIEKDRRKDWRNHDKHSD